MSANILSDKWRGERDAPLDPSATRFKAVAEEGPPCAGYMFAGQATEVCDRAGKIIRAAGGPDCCDRAPTDGTYIYVIDKSDPRQMDLLKEANT